MYDPQQGIRLKRLSYAVSVAVASLVASHAALAQEQSTPQASPASQSTNVDVQNAGADSKISTVTVVATRRSQQSSIERKKNAATAIDSIVAEDVGALPDRNIGEAISRMAGIALDRGDFGEGTTVAVRGNGPDLTRVEIDGMAAQSANSASGTGGRGNDFSSLSADLIKSVDVVKGSTADMTEGSLGGGIIIKTRTGLDFKEPFASLRVAGQTNNLSKKWEPDTNLILSRKFMDNRLGVILNASKSTQANESHQMQVATSGAAGYARLIDFDNSPDKTFSYNPATLNMTDPASTTPIGTYGYNTGTGSYTTATPQEILTKSAAAQTKAQCYSAFPTLTVTDPSLANLSSGNRTNAVNARQNELISCLNQWNDYTPSMIRNRVATQVDRRQNIDLRGDFKVNRELTVYAKGSYSKWTAENNTSYLNLGTMNVNPSKSYLDTVTKTPDGKTSISGVRTVAPGAAGTGFFLYPNNPSYVSGVPTAGTVTDVDPSTVTVDASHHVTSFGISDGAAGIDQIYQKSNTITKAFQTGGEWRHGPMLAEWLVGDARSNYTTEQFRTSFASYYGKAQLSVLPSGLWSYSFPGGIPNLYDAASYNAMVQPDKSSATTAGTTYMSSTPGYSSAQQPLLTYSQPQLSYTPQITGTEEMTAKGDFTFQLPESVPYFTRFKTGFNLRDTKYNTVGGGGYQVSNNPMVYAQRELVRDTLVGCQDTPGSLGTGGNKCQYGYVPSTRWDSQGSGTINVTPAQFQTIIGDSLAGNITNTQFFNGAKGNLSTGVTNWPNIDVRKAFNEAGVTNANLDCIYSCTGTDGKTYQQPVTRMSERSEAAYVMSDFNFDHIPFTSRSLPFGWEIDGNLGYRYIRTKVHGIGIMQFRSITKIPGVYDPANPNAAGGVNDVTVQTNTAVDGTSHDFLPIYNLAMWMIPDQLVLRYNRARTVARPPVTDLLPAGLCTYDERVDVGGSQSCSGKAIGNPALRAQKNLNQNWSAEYYPNKDTMVSLAYFKQEGLVGPAIVQTETGNLGLNLVDPTTGISLASMPFSYPTYENGVPTTRKGWEFNTKTAFTFLPWRLRYLGFDGNYTKLASVTSTQNFVDLLTGTPLPPLRESKFQYNWAFWYDDGRLSARIAVQGVGNYFNNISGSSSNYLNNYPNVSGNTRPPAYNPGSPNFKDATRYVDAKIQYKITPNIDVFVEGRNLGNASSSDSQGQYVPFSNGTPSILDYSYSGRRIMVGADFRFGG